MSADRDPAVEALIRDGRQAYAAKRYKNALECFTRVRLGHLKSSTLDSHPIIGYETLCLHQGNTARQVFM